MIHSLRASPVFTLVVLVAIALFGLIGVMLFGGLLGLSERIAAMGHFGSRIHLTHDLTYAFLFGTAAVGMLAQLRTPSKNVAGQLMALIPWVGFGLAFALGNILVVLLRPPFVPIFGALTLLTIMLHPTWRNLFSSFSVSRVNWVLLPLVITAALPLLAFAFTNIGLQRTVIDSHAAQAHYGYMAAFSFTVIGVGLLASLRPNGWWLPAWVAGLLPALLGLASVVLPDVTSSLGLVWALAAVAWGVVFVAAAELTRDAERLTLLGSWGIIPELRGPRGVISKGVRPNRGPTTSTPLWVKVFGIIALIPILLVVINMVAGVFGGPGGHGPGRHTPSGDAGRQGNTPPIAGGPELAITAADLAFGPDRIELTAGEPVNVGLTSADILHDLVVDEIEFHLAAYRNETVIGGLVFNEPDTYAGYCSVPSHRESGMELEIVVTPSGDAGGHTPPGVGH
jgi:plastocyanin